MCKIKEKELEIIEDKDNLFEQDILIEIESLSNNFLFPYLI
ncbi:MAG: hypothetical protein U0354_02990 [Candidatus Sericytochromatia bacterium]